MLRLNINQLLAIILFVFSLGYLWMAFQIPVFPIPRPVDSDAFPKMLGACLLILSVFLFLEKEPAKVSEVKTDKETNTDEDLPQKGIQNPKVQVFGASIAVLAYAFLIEPLGFLAASILLGVGLSFWFGYRNHTVNLVTVAGIVVSLYVLLSKVLGIYLPQGIIPF